MSIARHTLRLALTSLLLAGCAGTPPAPIRLYQLSAQPAASPAVALGPASLGVGPIEWPEYLDRRPLLVRLDAHTLTSRDNERWAEALDLNFARVLREDLAASLGATRVVAYPWNGADPPAVSLRIEVLQFDSDGSGAATLRMRWRLVAPGDPAAAPQRLGEWRVAARDASVAAAVAAQSEALAALAREVVETLAAR